jgi:sec-independent protein translocase protein TatB
MLDFSWSHILIVLVVALVVVGPKDLPRLMRTAGQWAGKARRMANELRASFDEMARQSELDDLRKEIEALRAERPLADFDRIGDHGILPTGESIEDLGREAEPAAVATAAPETPSAAALDRSDEDSGHAHPAPAAPMPEEPPAS